MANKITLARPYARAVFAEAKAKGQLHAWSEVMGALSQIVQDQLAAQWMLDPRLSPSQLESMLCEWVEHLANKAVMKLGDALGHFIALLVKKKRLAVLPPIAFLYHQLVLEEEHMTEAELIAAFPVSEDHRCSIEAALGKRFNSKIQLKVSKDESLIGGALIRAGNWVLDGSIKGKLAKLTESLMG